METRRSGLRRWATKSRYSSSRSSFDEYFQKPVVVSGQPRKSFQDLLMRQSTERQTDTERRMIRGLSRWGLRGEHVLSIWGEQVLCMDMHSVDMNTYPRNRVRVLRLPFVRNRMGNCVQTRQHDDGNTAWARVNNVTFCNNRFVLSAIALEELDVSVHSKISRVFNSLFRGRLAKIIFRQQPLISITSTRPM